MFDDVFHFIESQYPDEQEIPLHRPLFDEREKKVLSACIDSTYVSSVGPFISEFENKLASYTGSRFAIATTNGTCALHLSLLLAGVRPGDEVITQALTFVGTSNAIAYANADPVYLDVDSQTMGLSPAALLRYLHEYAVVRELTCFNKKNNKRISACVPMHTFGHPAAVVEIASICQEFSIPLVEDAAESLGSWVGSKHTGTFGLLGILSFNGNKIITTGGGGMILTDNEELAIRAKHLSTTAKKPHAYEFYHDQVGFNYRLPNLNAALGLAQFEKLEKYLLDKKTLANAYKNFFVDTPFVFQDERNGVIANCWLNSILVKDLNEREVFLRDSLQRKIHCRPIWQLNSNLPAFKNCYRDDLSVSQNLASRLINLPSSVRKL